VIVTKYDNARTFLDIYEAILLEREAVGQLILYNAYQNRDTSASEQCLFGAVLEEAGNAVLLFCNVKPYRLVVFIINQDKNLMDTSVAALADFIIENLIPITGIIAKYDVCQSFINQYKKDKNCSFIERQGMDIMEIRQVNDIKPVEGIHRPASEEEVKLIADWIIQYQIETLAIEMDYAEAKMEAAKFIENKQIYIYVDKENKIVSMAATTRRLLHGIAISYIFTPEEFRGEGYAAANLYYLSKELFESGYQFCTLFADKNNPVSSRAYEKVGFKIIDDNYDYQLLPV
jgi:predicted GNAT family acetyltransferase